MQYLQGRKVQHMSIEYTEGDLVSFKYNKRIDMCGYAYKGKLWARFIHKIFNLFSGRIVFFLSPGKKIEDITYIESCKLDLQVFFDKEVSEFKIIGEKEC